MIIIDAIVLFMNMMKDSTTINEENHPSMKLERRKRNVMMNEMTIDER